jgi:hypothetical protein
MPYFIIKKLTEIHLGGWRYYFIYHSDTHDQ